MLLHTWWPTLKCNGNKESAVFDTLFRVTIESRGTFTVFNHQLEMIDQQCYWSASHLNIKVL